MTVEVVDIPFVGPAYESVSKAISAQESLNVYPEMNQDNTKPKAMIQRPGRRLFANIGGGGRAYWEMDGTAYVAAGTTVYTVDSAGTATSIGTIASGGRMGVAHDGTQALLCGISNSYKVTSSAVTEVTDPDMPQGPSVTYHNGYWLKSVSGTNEFAASAIDDPTTWATLDNAFERQTPGDVVAILSDHAELLLLKTKAIGFWFESSAATGIPFDRQAQLILQTGVIAANSVVGSLDERVFFLGQQANTTPMVYVLEQRNARKISTPAIDHIIAGYDDPEDAYAWEFSHKGHAFYVLTFPNQGTWAYDVSTREWHQWALYGLADYDASHSLRIHGKTLILNRSGNLHELDDTLNQDAGTTMVRRRVTAPLEYMGRPFRIDWIELDAEVGTGTGEVLIRLSHDRGFTWSEWRSLEMTEGNYTQRLKWWGFGMSREFIAQVQVSDDIKAVWTGLRAGVRIGRN